MDHDGSVRTVADAWLDILARVARMHPSVADAASLEPAASQRATTVAQRTKLA